MSRGRPFEPGNKLGRGRPRGSRNKTPLNLQRILDQYSEPLLKVTIVDAMKGDKRLRAMLLDRILPRRQGSPVSVGSIQVRTAEEVSKASRLIAQKVASGQITTSEGSEMMDVLEKVRKCIETEELEKRVHLVEVAREYRGPKKAA